MSNERRKHERANLKRDDIPGAFFLDVDEQSVQFFHVNDVSISGMGIDLSMELDEGREISLRYDSDDFHIELSAKVVWCESTDTGLYRIGIQFNPANMNENVMFFMTLREFVDDFGEAF